MEEKILQEIQKANSILLHLHPSPDCDSQGSALAMYHVLKGMDKKVDVIKGDSDIDPNMAHLPGAENIVPKNFLEVDQKNYDLFIILDSTLDRVTTKGPCVFEQHLRTINIDHHASNKGGADMDFIKPTAPATSVILFYLFKKWGINFTNAIARNLLLGIYTDTGNLTHNSTNQETLQAVMELRPLAPEFNDDLTKVYSITEDVLKFDSLAYKNIEKYGVFALAAVSLEEMKKENVDPSAASANRISSTLRNVHGFDITAGIVEDEPNHVKVSLRTRDPKYDLSKIALSLGGGGHKMASGALLKTTFLEAKQRVIKAVSEYTSTL